jgi:acetoacetyl-CoA synthetase
MRKPLWTPSDKGIKEANITSFMSFVNKKHDLRIDTYDNLHKWSIDKISDFWAAVWEFVEIKASRGYDLVIDDLNKFPGAKWFSGSKLNFAENLLRFKDDHVALSFRGEPEKTVKVTYAELHDSVADLATSLRQIGVERGDPVVAYMPNLVETAVAMLATTSIGAIWGSCGTELGSAAVVTRLGQVDPKVLFTVDGYTFKGKIFDLLPRVEEVAKGIPSLEKVVVIPYANEKPDLGNIPCSVGYSDFAPQGRRIGNSFEQLPFEHPLYFMFSSGTTGKPKCMVQGAGGVLVNHLKELILHTDLKREDRILYITTPSWMMWNWLLSSLAVGATVVLYDGSATYPDWHNIWKFNQDEKITIFGCSATYINYLITVQAEPGNVYNLSSLREISQTGSPLSSEGFRYVYEKIKGDLHFNSISGGTDINGCFAIGTPIQPVYAGELQSPALGMKVKAYDEKGIPVVDKRAELVCELPSPSMPLFFLNDVDRKRYNETYFSVYPGVWRHGDWIMIHSDTGGITFLGRSDFTLKPLGVRIGPAEIYNIVEKLGEIADSLAVGQNWKGDQRIILFVKLTPGSKLLDNLKSKIKKILRHEASPRHVPAVIIEVPDIPYTFNMKKVESTVSNIINGRPVTNRSALVNPVSLDFYMRILPELQKE